MFENGGAILVGDLVAVTELEPKWLVTPIASLDTKIFVRPATVGSMNQDLVWILTNQGSSFLISNDEGRTWDTRQMPVDGPIDDLRFFNSRVALALSNNTIWKSTNAGETWQKVAVTGYNVRRLYLKPATQSLFIVGDVFSPVPIN
jgi:hypothetical protein